MSAFMFISWSLAYTSGLVMISFLILIWRRTLDTRARATLALMVPFYLLVVTLTFWELGQRLDFPETAKGIIDTAALLCVAALIFSFPFFGNEMKAPGARRSVSLAFALLAGIGGAALLAGAFFSFQQHLLIPLYGLFTVAIIYSISVGILSRFDRSPSEESRSNPFLRSAVTMAILGLPFFPAFFFLDFFYQQIPFLQRRVSVSFTLLPLFFTLWAVNLLVHILPLLREAPLEDRGEPDLFETKRRAFALEKGLTPREAEVLIPLTEGLSYKDIASALYISLATVKTHICRIYEKTGCPTRAELIHRIRENQPFG